MTDKLTPEERTFVEAMRRWREKMPELYDTYEFNKFFAIIDRLAAAPAPDAPASADILVDEPPHVGEPLDRRTARMTFRNAGEGIPATPPAPEADDEPDAIVRWKIAGLPIEGTFDVPAAAAAKPVRLTNYQRELLSDLSSGATTVAHLGSRASRSLLLLHQRGYIVVFIGGSVCITDAGRAALKGGVS